MEPGPKKEIKGILKRPTPNEKKQKKVVDGVRWTEEASCRYFTNLYEIERWELDMEVKYGWDYDPYRKMYFYEIDEEIEAKKLHKQEKRRLLKQIEEEQAKIEQIQAEVRAMSVSNPSTSSTSTTPSTLLPPTTTSSYGAKSESMIVSPNSLAAPSSPATPSPPSSIRLTSKNNSEENSSLSDDNSNLNPANPAFYSSSATSSANSSPQTPVNRLVTNTKQSTLSSPSTSSTSNAPVQRTNSAREEVPISPKRKKTLNIDGATASLKRSISARSNSKNRKSYSFSSLRKKNKPKEKEKDASPGGSFPGIALHNDNEKSLRVLKDKDTFMKQQLALHEQLTKLKLEMQQEKQQNSQIVTSSNTSSNSTSNNSNNTTSNNSNNTSLNTVSSNNTTTNNTSNNSNNNTSNGSNIATVNGGDRQRRPPPPPPPQQVYLPSKPQEGVGNLVQQLKEQQQQGNNGGNGIQLGEGSSIEELILAKKPKPPSGPAPIAPSLEAGKEGAEKEGSGETGVIVNGNGSVKNKGRMAELFKSDDETSWLMEGAKKDRRN